MRIRPYIPVLDFEKIKNWSTDERTHTMWCANLFQYPIEKENFHSVIQDFAIRCGDSGFVATTDDGEPVGFFCYALDFTTNEGMLKFVMVDPKQRGMGIGKQMLKLAVEYAFCITKADSVQLNVFLENPRARKCYEGVGFVERKSVPNSFPFHDELWGKCNMVIRKTDTER